MFDDSYHEFKVRDALPAFLELDAEVVEEDLICIECFKKKEVQMSYPCKDHSKSEETIQIVISGRIDYCGDCGAEHGYVCPKDICS